MNVITWNMQGANGFGENKWNTDVKRLFRAGAQVILLQECGQPPGSAQPALLPPPGGAGVPPLAVPPWLGAFAPPGALNWNYYLWNIGTRRRPCIIGIYWVETDPVGRRVNLAIATVVAADIGGAVVPINLIYVPPPIAGTRPAIGIRVALPGGNANLFTLHAISPGGANAPGLLTNIHVYGPPWFVAGDFNRLPATWAGVVPPVGTQMAPNTGDATHPGSGTNLDYGLINPGPVPPAGQVMTNFVVSDHYPVLYIL